MERCCRCVRFAVRCVRVQFQPLLPPLMEQVVTLYQARPHSCFLYLGSIVVDEFSSVGECVPVLLEMLDAFLPKTYQLLQVRRINFFFLLHTRGLKSRVT